MNAPAFDFNTKAMRGAAISDRINEHLEAGLHRKRALQPRREYVGASGVGGLCERAIQFEFAGAPREREFKPATLRKFDFGHLTEEWCRQELGDAGFEVMTVDKKTRASIAFSQMGGKFKGHPDGVIVEGPEIPGITWPCIWEHKGVGSKSYKAIEKDGIKKAKPQYYAQIQVMQAYLGFQNPAIFTVTNLDSGEQLHLAVPFDAEEAQAMSDRAVRIVTHTEAGQLLPRPFNDPAHFVCKGMCDFPTRCWSLPK